MRASFGAPHSGSSAIKGDFIAKRRERWQERALNLITSIPEPSGASVLIENTLNRVILTVSGDKVKKTDRKAIEQVLNTFDKGRAGMLLWQVGECYPLWRQNDDGELEWEVNSPLEIDAETNKPLKLMGSNDKPRPLASNERIFRMWRPHPANKFMAWSPHLGLLDTMEAMYKHQLADTAVADSRLAGAGLLYWPTDLPSLPLKDGRPEEGSREQLQEELTHAMMQSIDNRKSADAVVPLIVFGDPTLGDNFKPEHILLERPDDAKAFSERIETYSKRYARGVELPIESVQGMGPANHWTAWVIKEDKWRFYVNPIAETICKALTKNFLHPLLLEMGYAKDLLRDIKIVPDGSALIEKPDKSDAAIRLATLGGYLNDEAVLRETGFDPATDIGDGQRAAEKTRISPMPVSARDTSPNG